MRFAWYSRTTVGLAAAVLLNAFYQRPNFYAAMVHLAQSNLSLLVLFNLILYVYGMFVYSLQRLCFGRMRPIEIEQLYEKAWFAATETCLAMTIFRDEVGFWFLIMFTALATGKLWAWIGEGRVEIFEQQPPANPRLFHARLSLSLLLSVVYDAWMLIYAGNKVYQQARPSMMVMFLFEFAVLFTTSLQTSARYAISIVEERITKKQTQQRLDVRRKEIREQKAEILRRREGEGPDAEAARAEILPDEEDVDEMDIEVPGWESKGLYVLTLDLIADFAKLGIYTAFFCVLFTFFGLPIHIMRDWFLTTRSFFKRANALIRYRQAVAGMAQYPDATPTELGRENTCIVCREEMDSWNPEAGQMERSRPKKLPCGHILHYGCLKSWLERQQVCPTCRRPVIVNNNTEAAEPRANGEGVLLRIGGLNIPGGPNRDLNEEQQPLGDGQEAGDGPGDADGADPGERLPAIRNGGRMFNIGPIRLGFAQGEVADLRGFRRRGGDARDLRPPTVALPPPQQSQAARLNGTGGGGTSLDQLRAQVMEACRRSAEEARAAQVATHELQYLLALTHELHRIEHLREQIAQPRQADPMAAAQTAHPQRSLHQHGQVRVAQAQSLGAQDQNQGQTQAVQEETVNNEQNATGQPIPTPTAPLRLPMPPPGAPIPTQQTMFLQPGHVPVAFLPQPYAQPGSFATRHGGAQASSTIPSGSPDLPEGVVIPQGWSLLPLHRMDNGFTDLSPGLGAWPPAHQAEAPVMGASQASAAPNTATGAADEGCQNLPGNTACNDCAPPTAPASVIPNWGGSAQLFPGSSTGNVFDIGTRPSRSNSPAPAAGGGIVVGGASGSATAGHQVADVSSPGKGKGVAPAPAAHGGAIGGSGETRRTATVEDAEDGDTA